MKKSYSSPLVMVEEFTPNEYVASACGSGNEYSFKCDTSSGGLLWFFNWQNAAYCYDNFDGTLDGVGSGESTKLPPIDGCGESHTSRDASEFRDGYILHRSFGGDSRYPVIVWMEKDGNGGVVDYHLTKKVDVKQWSVARS